MKNTDRQKQLDEKKYFEGFRYNRDMSGLMEYCRNCKYRDKPYHICGISQKQREEECAYAKAFNKMNKI